MLATAPAPVRSFVPATFDPADLSQIRPLYQNLLDRAIASPADLERLLADFSELAAAVREYGDRRYIDKSRHTDDADAERAFLHYVEHVDAPTKPLYSAVQKKYLNSPYRAQLDPKRYAMLDRNWQADLDVYRDTNVPLESESAKLVSDYDKLRAAVTVTIDGTEYTLPQIYRLLEEHDRPLRERTWKADSARVLQDREAYEDLFDKLFALRRTIARNAGFPDYRAYLWRFHHRFDYAPDDCLRFADAIAETCVPMVDAINDRRAADLKLDRLRPWDTAVDPLNRPPLRPFAQDDIPGFVDKTKQIVARLSPDLADDLELLRAHGNLDLDSRKHKQPGGYMNNLEESKIPFIFMNAAGTWDDIQTLLHEAGHAFHFLAAGRHVPLTFLRIPGVEFIEVPSMAMELLGCEHLDVFYADTADAARAKRAKLEGVLRMLPWIAIVDSFQHWLYTHPEHTRDQRTTHWLSLQDRFAAKRDWNGLEPARAASWHGYSHLFHNPFYYIEYGIALLGALQIWLKYKEDPRRAIANYRHSLTLAGTRPLPDLFAAAGARFDFSPATLRPLMHAVQNELDSLPR